MSSIVPIPVILLILTVTSLHFTTCQDLSNNRPIIGILAQEVSDFTNAKLRPKHYDSYIAASYVKFLEGAGARVVPIWIGKNQSYYENIMSKINGILWPGGGANFTAKHGYGEAGYRIYKIARTMNNRGDYFPIFAICLGFEMLMYLTAGRQPLNIPCNSEKQALPLKFTPEYRNSSMFGDAPVDVIEMLKGYTVTANFHHFCVTEQGLRSKGIRDKFRILSFNYDFDGKKFISSVESTEYPFYGLQFHPEKNLYEWFIGGHIPHSWRAVQVAQYFANFFVNEARKNDHQFLYPEEEARSLIYNYSPIYTALKGILFQQCYMFKNT